MLTPKKKGVIIKKQFSRVLQVDERTMKRPLKMLHGELAASLKILVEEVGSYISHSIEAKRAGRSIAHAAG